MKSNTYDMKNLENLLTNIQENDIIINNEKIINTNTYTDIYFTQEFKLILTGIQLGYNIVKNSFMNSTPLSKEVFIMKDELIINKLDRLDDKIENSRKESKQDISIVNSELSTLRKEIKDDIAIIDQKFDKISNSLNSFSELLHSMDKRLTNIETLMKKDSERKKEYTSKKFTLLVTTISIIFTGVFIYIMDNFSTIISVFNSTK